MGVYRRPDSPYWHLWLETAAPGQQRERTDVRIGATTAQRADSRRLAEDVYHQRMNEIAARLYRLPSAVPAIRFSKYADAYETDTIAHHKGKGRELEMLKALRGFFGDDLLTAIDQDRVKTYHTHRRATCAARTINREVDLLKAMLRDAVPKYLAVSPLVGMKRLAIVKPKRRLMSIGEEAKLLAAGDTVDRALIILAVDGLIRLGDLLDLKRSDRARGWLYVADPKSGEPYEVALSARAAKALNAITSGPYYFEKFRKAENPRDWPGSVRQRLQRLCERVHIPYGRKAGGLTFHWATRRTGATRLLVKRKAPLPAVQRQGNWKTPDVLLDIYAEADRQDQRRAVGGLTRRSRRERKRA